MNAADMRGTLSVIGYHLDVVSLAKASMVCRIWKAAFENHPKWREFYLNSDEYLQEPLDKKGPWKVLYGELFNKCKSLMHKRWRIERHQPGFNGIGWNLKCHGSFFVDDKLVIIADELLFMLKSQLKEQNELSLDNDDPNFQIKPPYRMIPFPDDYGCIKVEFIGKFLLDRNYLYASANNGQLLRWERNHFPSGCTRIIKKGVEIHDFKIQNEILYILKRVNNIYGYRRAWLYAYKNSEELWRLELTKGTESDITVNKNTGMIIERINIQFKIDKIPSGELYIWDSRKGEKPKHIGTGWHHVLMNDEVIYADGFNIVAHSLEGSRVIYEMDSEDIDAIIPNIDQNLIYIIAVNHYLITFSLTNDKVVSNIDIGANTLNFQGIKFFNGILYCVDESGRLLLIHPKKGIIRTGPEKMLCSQIEVHNGRVHGLNPERNKAVIIHAHESKTIKNKIKSFAEKIRKLK